MRLLKVLEWNINQRGGHGGGKIPSFVLSEIKASDADIAILTEFCTACPGRDKFIQSMEGYRCYASENAGGNDILIAVKECYAKPRVELAWKPCYGDDTIPENLCVNINVDGKMVSVFGVRIKYLNNIPIAKQMPLRNQELQWVLQQLNKLSNPVIIAGDFNNNRTGSPNPDWSLEVIDKLLPKGVVRHTPEGDSIWDVGCGFAYDHFIVKGMTLKELFPYSRKFVRWDSIVYPWGENFREPKQPGLRYKELETVSSPYPDHAILKAEFVLE